MSNAMRSFDDKKSKRKAILMRQLLGIILCLGLAACSVFAQETDDEVLQRLILEDIGVTQAEIMQFGVNMAGVVEPYEQYMAENKERFDNRTRENSKELVNEMFDNFIFPVVNDLRVEATGFFSEDQYAKMTTRLYQVIDISDGLNDNPSSGDILNAELIKTFLLPDLAGLDEKQLVDLAALQKEMLTDAVEIDLMLKEEYKHLVDEQNLLYMQLSQTETEEEKKTLKERLANVRKELDKVSAEPVRKMLEKMQGKLDTLLTAEQKAKLDKIRQDLPDYLREALLKQRGEKNDVSTEWRPGINSWMPGQGAPTDQKGYQREERQKKEPQGRRFPGSE